MTREPGDQPSRKRLTAVGCDGEERQMTTATLVWTKSDFLPIVMAAFLGMAVLFVTGFASADTLHGATHDTRHSTGFPCH